MASTWRVAILTLALICGVTSSHLAAQTTFGFTGVGVGTFTPFGQTVGGLTATFSSPLDLTGPKFSVQNASTTMFALSQFSGNYLYPNNLGVAPLVIVFNGPISSVSLTFATVESHIASRLFLTASLGTTPVGSVNTPGEYIPGDSYPQGTITFEGAVFDRIHLSVPAQGTEPAVAFLVDTITVIPTVLPPSAANDSYSTAFNTALNVAAPGVLANDTSNGGGAMTAVVVSTPTHGSLSLNSDGSFSYTPSLDYIGNDSFTYRASNAAGPGNTATVTITVNPPPVPTAADDHYSTPFNTTLNVAAPGVLANDTSNGGGTMTAAVVTTPTSGALSLSADGSFSYTPTSIFTGTDSFTYRASNLAGAGNVATVTITVNAPSVPTAVNDSYATAFNTTLTVAAPGVLGNDTSNGGGTMSAAVVSTPTNGSVSLSADGSFTYTPAADFIGDDSFTYRPSNLAGAGNVAAVSIAVAEPTAPQPPTGLYVSSVAGNRVTLRWTAAAIGPEATDFVVEGGLAAGEVLASLATGSASPIFTFAVPSGAFFIRVHQIAGADRSAASNEVQLYVNAPVAPSAPSSLVAVTNGSSVNLAWRNTFAGGAPAQMILDVTGSLTGSMPVTVSDQVRFTAVPAGSYTISVRAANAWGVSGSSNPVTLTVPTACTGLPSPPENFLFYKAGGAVSAVWDPAAAGPAATGYIVNLTGPFSISLPTPLRTVSGVPPPGTYSMTVAATNACGPGAPTATQTVVVP